MMFLLFLLPSNFVGDASSTPYLREVGEKLFHSARLLEKLADREPLKVVALPSFIGFFAARKQDTNESRRSKIASVRDEILPPSIIVIPVDFHRSSIIC